MSIATVRRRCAVATGILCLLAACASPKSADPQISTCIPAALGAGRIYTFEVDFVTSEPLVPELVRYRTSGEVEILGGFVITRPSSIEKNGHVGVQEWNESSLDQYGIRPIQASELPAARNHFIVLRVRITGSSARVDNVVLSLEGSKANLQGNSSLIVSETC